jgi:hypothetical protein
LLLLAAMTASLALMPAAIDVQAAAPVECAHARADQADALAANPLEQKKVVAQATSLHSVNGSGATLHHLSDSPAARDRHGND